MESLEFMKAMEKVTKIVEQIALLQEVLPPIEITTLEIKRGETKKQYIAILIEKEVKRK